MLMRYYNFQMAKASLIINLLISFLAIWSSSQLQPLITEFIVPFDLPINDLNAAASNQLSRNEFKTNTFKTDNVTVSKLAFKSIYNGSGRIIDPKEQSTFHTVWNDSVDLIVTYQADLHKLPTQKKTFNGTTKLKAYVNYTKTLIIDNDTTEVRAITVIVDQKSFQMSYTGNPTDAQKKKLDEINNGVVSGKNNITILSLLRTQQFTQQNMQTFFKENLVNQKISPTYQSTYNYIFSNNSYVFDMTTAGVDAIPHGIAHYLKGTINNFQSPQSTKESVAPYEEGYHSLFTANFFDYFMRYNTQKNPNWLNFKISNKNFPTSFFKFRLVDLQFLFPKIVSKYAQYYLKFINIVCTPKSFDNWAFDTANTNVKLDMVWHCQGKLDGPTPAALVFQFEASLNYLVEVRLYSDMLEVYVGRSNLVDMEFLPIEEEEVQDIELAKVYAGEVVEMLRGYTVGSSFKVKQNSSKLLLKEDIGLYVG